MINPSIGTNKFLSIFNELDNFHIDPAEEKEVKTFILPINAKEFNYERLKEELIEPLLGFCLSRKTINEYKKSPMILSKKARDKLRIYTSNKGELGELLLYCFLETDLKAPKILSKLELKTGVNDYVKGADGIHYKQVGNDYFLIFGEAKTNKSLNKGIKSALLSINDFKLGIRRDKKGKEIERNPGKYGISYDRTLISDHLDKETFSKEEKEFLKKIIVPTESDLINVQNGFAVFIGYEINITKLKSLKHSEFKDKLHELTKKKIQEKKDVIIEEIKKYGLEGHNFNFYFLPFSELEKNRTDITKSIGE